MAYMRMSGLGDALHVGPHYYPPRPEGAMLIERGPHGMRLAADPVKSRLGRPRGSGFRFWVEELNPQFKPDNQWVPQQRVVGMFGLGANGGGVSPATFVRKDLLVAAREVSPPAAAAAGTALSAFDSAAAQAARQNKAQAEKAFSYGVGQVSVVQQYVASTRHPKIVELHAGLLGAIAHTARIMQGHLARTPEEQAKYAQGTAAAETAHKLYKEYSEVRRPVTDDVLEALEKTQDDVNRIWLDMYDQTLNAVKNNWWKLALVLAGVVVLGGVSYGAGSGLARGLIGKTKG